MIRDQKSIPKILAVEPVGCDGHKSFNNFFLKCFNLLGCVTYVAPERFLDSCSVDSQICIPESLLRQTSKAGARLSGLRVLNYILKNISLENFDAIVFLNYETISFSVVWPKNRKVFLFEHNIDSSRGNCIKIFFDDRISSNAVRFVLQKHIKEFLISNYSNSRSRCEINKNRVVYIPHPHYRPNMSSSNNDQFFLPEFVLGKRITIFSPSGSTPQSVQDELKRIVSNEKGRFYAICKGESVIKSDYWEVQPFFQNYEELLRSCDMVFQGACFENRVSGVAYEALSFGKPIILLDCSFARELRREYPNMVLIINDLKNILTLTLNINLDKFKVDQERFLLNHSFSTISKIIKNSLLPNENPQVHIGM